jgi:hypothetical protein
MLCVLVSYQHISVPAATHDIMGVQSDTYDDLEWLWQAFELEPKRVQQPLFWPT